MIMSVDFKLLKILLIHGLDTIFYITYDKINIDNNG